MSESHRWIAGRVPAAPPALVARIDVALAESAGLDGSTIVDECLMAAERILGRLLATGSTQRSAALELLAADALATYAFEAASADPDALGTSAREAMVRLSALAVDRDASSPIGVT